MTPTKISPRPEELTQSNEQRRIVRIRNATVACVDALALLQSDQERTYALTAACTISCVNARTVLGS